MKDLVKYKVIDFCYVTDFVANGSFASLRENVSYINSPDYAVLVRLTDFTKKWSKDFVYVSKASYDFLKKSSLNKGDLIMSNVGEPGIVFLVPDLNQPMTLGPNSILIRPNKNTSTSKFLYFYFLSEIGKKQIDDISTGAAQKKFNKTSFRDIEINLPPLSEQQRIITILDEAFAAIAKALANAEQNLKNAKQLFESYLQGVFENKGEDWEASNLETYIKLIDYRGRTPIKTVSGVRLITAKNVKLGYLQLEPQEFIANNNYQSWMSRGIPNFGDVIFTTEAPLANVAQIDTLDKVAFAQRIIVMQPDPSKLNQTFLKYMLLSNPIRNRILDKGTGATVLGIKSSLLKKIEIYFPNSINEQKKIVEKLDVLTIETKRLEAIYQQKIKDLEELKKSVLQKAFSGEL